MDNTVLWPDTNMYVLCGSIWIPVVTVPHFPWVVESGKSLQIRRIAENILSNQSWTADRLWSSMLGFDVRLTNSYCKNVFVQKHHTERQNLNDSTANSENVSD